MRDTDKFAKPDHMCAWCYPAGFERPSSLLSPARSLAISGADSRVVYVSTRQLSNVYACVDADRDGQADTVTTVISDKPTPNGEPHGPITLWPEPHGPATAARGRMAGTGAGEGGGGGSKSNRMLRAPTLRAGIAWRDGNLFVVTPTSVWRYSDVDQHALDGTPFPAPVSPAGE